MGIFEGLKRLLGGSAEQPVASQQEQGVTGTLEQSASVRPWEDRSLSPERRLKSYKALVFEKLEDIQRAFDRAREAHDVATQKEIMNSPETKKWMDEGTWLQRASAEAFCDRIDRPSIIRELLGKNFLGAEAWKAQGIDVGQVPPFPDTITEYLLESDCPLHPGEKIKDTHLLVLVPQTVNGEPYSALRLDELCAQQKRSGTPLIYDQFASAIQWKNGPWAATPQSASEWVLLPKHGPDPKKVPEEKHFLNKNVTAQNRVHDEHYKGYREAGTVEIMTAVLLYALVNNVRLLPSFVRCREPNFYGGRVCLHRDLIRGLIIREDCDDSASPNLGRALAWRFAVAGGEGG